MDSNKEAEVRARVPLTTQEALELLAKARGEKMPVIVREALAEYLAKRVESHDQLQEIFQREPGVLEALINLAHSLRAPPPPVTYRKIPRKRGVAKLLT